KIDLSLALAVAEATDVPRQVAEAAACTTAAARSSPLNLDGDSPASMLSARNSFSAATRRVAIVLTPSSGGDVTEPPTVLVRALARRGMRPATVSARARRSTDSPDAAENGCCVLSFEATHSTAFDAVVFVGEPAAGRPSAAAARLWAREAFAHCKPVAAVGSSACAWLLETLEPETTQPPSMTPTVPPGAARPFPGVLLLLRPPGELLGADGGGGDSDEAPDVAAVADAIAADVARHRFFERLFGPARVASS
ncbi:hypothetical protein HK405_008366, partial [Cladochytrium tenue]